MDFRGLPSPSVLCDLDNILLGMGSAARVPAPRSILNCSFDLRLVNFSFRQLPSASVDFRGHPLTSVIYDLDDMLFGRGSVAKVTAPDI